MATAGQQILHLLVYCVGFSLGAVTHEHDSGFSVIVILCPVNDSVGNDLEILVGGEQRIADDHLLERVGIIRDLSAEFVILNTVHEVSGLYDKVLYTVCYGSVKRLAYVVNFLAVALVNVINNDIGSEPSSYGVTRECCFEVILDGADSQAAAVVEAGSEAEYQQLVVADLVLIPGVIEGSVAGVVVLVVSLSSSSGFSGGYVGSRAAVGILSGGTLSGGSRGGGHGLRSGAGRGGLLLGRTAGKCGGSSKYCCENDLGFLHVNVFLSFWNTRNRCIKKALFQRKRARQTRRRSAASEKRTTNTS